MKNFMKFSCKCVDTLKNFHRRRDSFNGSLRRSSYYEQLQQKIEIAFFASRLSTAMTSEIDYKRTSGHEPLS